MRKKFTLFILLLFAATGVTPLQAQSLLIKSEDGTVTTKELGTVKQMTFGNNNLRVNYFSGSTETYGLSTISKLYFKTLTTATQTISLNQGSRILSVYPNPADQVIYIQNIPEGTSPVYIYRMDGVLVLRSEVSEGNTCIQVGHLSKGIYLLRLTNQAVKFVKL